MNSGAKQNATKRNRDDSEPGKQQKAGKIETLHGKELGGSEHVAKGRASGTKAIGGTPDDRLGMHAVEGSSVGIQTTSGILRGTSAEDEYACRIVEEPNPYDIEGVPCMVRVSNPYVYHQVSPYRSIEVL